MIAKQFDDHAVVFISGSHQWRYKTECASLYIDYNAWKKALNVGVRDSR